MRNLQATLDQFHLSNERVPNELEELTKCLPEPSHDCIILAKQEDLIDEWGTPFVYQPSENRLKYTLTSLGADKQPGGEKANADFVVEGPQSPKTGGSASETGAQTAD